MKSLVVLPLLTLAGAAFVTCPISPGIDFLSPEVQAGNVVVRRGAEHSVLLTSSHAVRVGLSLLEPNASEARKDPRGVCTREVLTHLKTEAESGTAEKAIYRLMAEDGTWPSEMLFRTAESQAAENDMRFSLAKAPLVFAVPPLHARIVRCFQLTAKCEKHAGDQTYGVTLSVFPRYRSTVSTELELCGKVASRPKHLLHLLVGFMHDQRALYSRSDQIVGDPHPENLAVHEDEAGNPFFVWIDVGGFSQHTALGPGFRKALNLTLHAVKKASIKCLRNTTDGAFVKEVAMAMHRKTLDLWRALGLATEYDSLADLLDVLWKVLKRRLVRMSPELSQHLAVALSPAVKLPVRVLEHRVDALEEQVLEQRVNSMKLQEQVLEQRVNSMKLEEQVLEQRVNSMKLEEHVQELQKVILELKSQKQQLNSAASGKGEKEEL